MAPMRCNDLTRSASLKNRNHFGASPEGADGGAEKLAPPRFFLPPVTGLRLDLFGPSFLNFIGPSVG